MAHQRIHQVSISNHWCGDPLHLVYGIFIDDPELREEKKSRHDYFVTVVVYEVSVFAALNFYHYELSREQNDQKLEKQIFYNRCTDYVCQASKVVNHIAPCFWNTLRWILKWSIGKMQNIGTPSAQPAVFPLSPNYGNFHWATYALLFPTFTPLLPSFTHISFHVGMGTCSAILATISFGLTLFECRCWRLRICLGSRSVSRSFSSCLFRTFICRG